MKEYLKQFYTEGLATTFYTKPVNYLKAKIKNRKLAHLFTYIIKVLYTILVLGFAGYILIRKLKK